MRPDRVKMSKEESRTISMITISDSEKVRADLTRGTYNATD